MNFIKFSTVLLAFSLMITNADAGFISEIGLNYKRCYSGFYELTNEGNWINAGGITIGKSLGKDKTYIFTGINYIPTILIDSKAQYLQIPFGFRTYFFNRIIFVEAGLEARWLINFKIIEYNQHVQEYACGYNFAVGVQQPIRNNLFLNLKAFLSNGFSFEQRKANMTNYGLETEIVFAIK